MSNFISVKHNKFEDKTTTEAKPCKLKKGWEFSLRHVSTPTLDDIVLDIHYIARDWFFLRDGSLIINVDGLKNFAFEPNESYSDVTEYNDVVDSLTGNSESNVGVMESCFYVIPKEQLQAISEAKAIDIQVSGGNGNKTVLDGEKFRLYVRAFYSYFSGESHEKAVKEYKELTRGQFALIPVLILAGCLFGAHIGLIGFSSTDHTVMGLISTFLAGWIYYWLAARWQKFGLGTGIAICSILCYFVFDIFYMDGIDPVLVLSWMLAGLFSDIVRQIMGNSHKTSVCISFPLLPTIRYIIPFVFFFSNDFGVRFILWTIVIAAISLLSIFTATKVMKKSSSMLK